VLTPERIKSLIESDYNSPQKKKARIGQRYYKGDHDIKRMRFFFIDKEGKVREDTTKSRAKITRRFLAELVDQSAQYQLSGKDGFIRSDIPELQKWMDIYFNNNRKFRAELYKILVGCEVKGVEYAYAYKNAEGRTCFMRADSAGVVEVRARETDDNCEYIIYWYVDRINKDNKAIKRIEVWDSKQVTFFKQVDNGPITPDENEKNNPRPHNVYTKDGEDGKYGEDYGVIPFFPLRNNPDSESSLDAVKDHIDDFDIMNCGLSDNIQDAAEVLVVVRGFEGDDIDEFMQNVKAKKHVGTPTAEDNVEYRTIDIPVEARKVKMEIDEKNIFHDGRGVNMEGLRDSGATVTIAVRAAYFGLDMKCEAKEYYLEEFLDGLVQLVLDEINKAEGSAYKMNDVYYVFERESITNALENAQIKQIDAQTRNMEITTLLNIESRLGNEKFMELVCEQLELDYEDIKDKLPKPEENDPYAPGAAKGILDGITLEDEGPDAGGDMIE
jgi:SPP1 family phage portal protein